MSDTGARLVGITLVVATVIGLAGGYWLDRWFGTAPWLLMIGLGFGIAAGFVNLFDQSSDTTVGRQRSGQLDLDDGPESCAVAAPRGRRRLAVGSRR